MKRISGQRYVGGDRQLKLPNQAVQDVTWAPQPPRPRTMVDESLISRSDQSKFRARFTSPSLKTEDSRFAWKVEAE